MHLRAIDENRQENQHQNGKLVLRAAKRGETHGGVKSHKPE